MVIALKVSFFLSRFQNRSLNQSSRLELHIPVILSSASSSTLSRYSGVIHWSYQLRNRLG